MLMDVYTFQPHQVSTKMEGIKQGRIYNKNALRPYFLSSLFLSVSFFFGYIVMFCSCHLFHFHYTCLCSLQNCLICG
jgi:hypothetical protein